jgi:uncharacterized protein with NAD-binding domain and iron-sulfur cluster
MVSTASNGKIRVAILGGGLGSMSTAFHLTATPEARARFDVTVYQQGWRVGGKGASGRNLDPKLGKRIEEHGLHAFLGFYENAFSTMRAAYAEWQKQPENPFQTWQDAFEPQFQLTLADRADGDLTAPSGWSMWNLTLPELPGMPGDGKKPSLLEYALALLKWIGHFLLSARAELAGTEPPASPSPIAHLAHDALGVAHAMLEALHLGAATATSAPSAPPGHGPIAAQLRVFKAAVDAEIRPHAASSPVLRRLWMLLDLGIAVGLGMVCDVLPPFGGGLDAINHLDFKDWLEQHGATRENAFSSPVRALYDLGFATVGGDASNRDFAQSAAGVALYTFLELGMGYKHAPMWKMRAGMGDTVFTPLYEVLAARGVKFEFFRRVQKLSLSDDGNWVDAIELSRQAIETPGYPRLIDVKGLPCWPSEPDWAHLENGPAMKQAGVNFESAWCLQEVDRRTLKLGEDFDAVVIGMSVAALPYVAGELFDAREAWRAMRETTKTVQTQALQLWLLPDLAGLGWHAGTTVMTAYAEPLDSWGEMSHLLVREDWPAPSAGGPQSVEYFCSPMQDPPVIPPFTDAGFPARELARAKALAQQWLEARTGLLWPAATTAANPAGLDYAKLVDLGGGEGLARLSAQYFRANVDPTERYVLSVPGSIQFRLAPAGSGFENVFLAGDWTKTTLSAGCAEAATESGILAAKGMLAKYLVAT